MSDNAMQKVIPPQNLDAEKAVLGCLLLDETAFDKVSFLNPDTFYLPQHRLIFETIREIINGGGIPDILLLTEKLQGKSALDKVGGPAYIAALPSLVPTTANIEYYANLIFDAAVKRSLVHVSSDIHARCFEPAATGAELLETAQQKLFDLTEAGQKATYATPKDLVGPMISDIEVRSKNPNAMAGVPSGFPSLDFLTNGFQNSDLIIIGARPGIGKTALALSMMAQMTVHANPPIPVAFFSLEMGRQQIMYRLAAIEANVSMTNMRNGRVTQVELSRLADAAANIYEKPAYIVDMPNMKMLDLKALARQLVRAEHVKLIFIDYIGLITSDNPYLQPFDQMAEISRSLKALARELNIPIIALSQLTRDAEGTKPTLANIRGSGAIEQDADIVMFLNRDRNLEESDEKGLETNLIISKHRNGPTGHINLMFISKYAKYTEESRYSNNS